MLCFLVLILLPLNQKLASKPVSLENLQQCSQKQAVKSKVKIRLQTPTYWELYNPTSWITKVTCSNTAQYPMNINQKHLFSTMLWCKQNEKLDKETLHTTVFIHPSNSSLSCHSNTGTFFISHSIFTVIFTPTYTSLHERNVLTANSLD